MPSKGLHGHPGPKVLIVGGTLGKLYIHSIKKNPHKIPISSCKTPAFSTSRMWFLDKIVDKWRWHRILFIDLRQLLEHKTLGHMENAVPGTQSHSLSPSLQASGEWVECPWQKKNYCISVHLNQQLFQVRISLKSSLHLLFVLCFLRTPFFHCRCWTAWLGSASSWFCRWQWREAQEVNGAFISFLEKVLLILWRGSKGDKTIGKNIEALWSQ